MDKLSCLLCRNNYKQPKMCSHCSEIYCRKCIEGYLSKYHCCPSCNHVLPDLADCTRLIAQLRQHVKQSPTRKYKNCRLHDLPLKYQCLDCSIAICSDCGVIQEKHRGHKLQQRGKLNRDFPKAKLRQYLISVEQCILKDHTNYQQLILEREVLRSELRWSKNRLKEYYEQMNKRLEDEANKRMADIVSSIEDKDKKMDKLKKLKDDLTEILELGDLSDEEALHKINPNNQILQDLQLDNQEELFTKLNQMVEGQKDAQFFSFNRKSLTTLNEVYPQYINHTYEFDYQAHQFSTIKYSEPFHIYGQEWRLKIYPKGNGQSPNHLSLFLQLLNSVSKAPNPTLGSNNSPQSYYFRLELISLNTAGKTISKEYISPFAIGDCWGYNDFVKLNELGEYLNNGHLIIVIGIRNCSYFDVCENMRRYIRKLQGEKKVLEELLSTSNLQSAILFDRHQFELSSIATSRLLSDTSNIVIDSD